MEERTGKGSGLWRELKDMVAFSAFGHLVLLAAFVSLASSLPPEKRAAAVYTVNLVETFEKAEEPAPPSMPPEDLAPEPPPSPLPELIAPSRSTSPPERTASQAEEAPDPKEVLSPPLPSNRPVLPEDVGSARLSPVESAGEPLHLADRAPKSLTVAPMAPSSQRRERSAWPPSELTRLKAGERSVPSASLPTVPEVARRERENREKLSLASAPGAGKPSDPRAMTPKSLSVASAVPSTARRPAHEQRASPLTAPQPREDLVRSAAPPEVPEVARLDVKKEHVFQPPVLPSTRAPQGAVVLPRASGLTPSTPGPVGRAGQPEAPEDSPSTPLEIVREGQPQTPGPVRDREWPAPVMAEKGASAALVLPTPRATQERAVPQLSGLEPVLEREYIPLDTRDPNLTPYTGPIKAKIERVWRYPDDSPPGLSGVTELGFTVERDGSVSRVEVLRSAGDQGLDRAAVEALKRASPFWPIPSSLNRERVKFSARFKYNMEDNQKE